MCDAREEEKKKGETNFGTQEEKVNTEGTRKS